MNEQELDEIYAEFCRVLGTVGEAHAVQFLARFALLAFHEIGDAGRLRALIYEARPETLSAGQSSPKIGR